MKYGIFAAMALATGLLLASGASAVLRDGPGDVPFWISVAGPSQIDRQVDRLMADRASVVILRIPTDHGAASEVKSAVQKMRQALPQTPILMYAWASRDKHGTPGSAGVMDWLDSDGDMQLHNRGGRVLPGFADVTLPEYRKKAASSIAAAVTRGGYDGVMLDLAVRTPTYLPRPLARLCELDASFCSRYAAGMDATFAAIREALGKHALAYNGIWNFGPGSVQDQMKLLDHSDAAAIEYFGSNPRAATHSFTVDILPYLQAMAQTSDDRKLWVFGRGSWQYTSYADDYLNQRYLYCAYLLGKRKNTYFKYHDTFQGDTIHGRTGGFSVYDDWSADIGAPRGTYSATTALYTRQFQHGLVIVAPDDGHGGAYKLAQAMYTPEGEKLTGSVSLKPGEGLLLLDHRPMIGNDQSLLDLNLLSDWPKAVLSGTGSKAILTLQDGAPVGSHDMLLDVVRSLHPRQKLHLVLQATGKQPPQLQIVAEIDDSAGRNEYAVVDIGPQASGSDQSGYQAIEFRTTDSSYAALPAIPGPSVAAGSLQTIDIDGKALFAKSHYVFRRWDFVRFGGAMKIESVALSN